MKKNYIYNLIYQILILILPIITVPYVSRCLGADGIGEYSFTYSIAYYFMIFAMLGINNHGNRTIAKSRENKRSLSKSFWSLYLFQLIMSLAILVLYLLFTLIFMQEYRNLALLQSLYVISCMFDINWFFFGTEKFRLTITRNIVIKVISFLSIFIFVRNTEDVWIYTLILAGSTLLSNLVLFSFLKRYVVWVKVGWKDIAAHIKPNLVMFLPVIAVSVYNVMDKIMLGIMSSVSEVGYYENAEKIKGVCLSLITALGVVSLPRVSNMISKNQHEKIANLIRKTMKFSLFLSIPMVIGIICVGQNFAVVFFGDDFSKSGVLLQLLSVTLLFMAWGNVIRTQYLIPYEKDKIYVRSAFIGAFVNFVCNMILIPFFSAIGACIGTILAELVVTVYQSLKVKKEIPLVVYFRDGFGFLAKAVLMATIVIITGFLVGQPIARIVCQIVVGSVAYSLMNRKYLGNELGLSGMIMKIPQKIKRKEN